MELTVIEKTAFNKLPESLRPFTEARIEKPIKNIHDIELKGKCLEIIGVSFAEQGQMGIEPSVMAFQRDCLFTELRSNSRFGTLTLTEVRNAFKMGIRGESGPFFGMCPKTYHQFLKYYYDRPERIEGMKQYLALIEEPKRTEKPLHVKLDETAKSCLNAFEHYKQTKELPFACGGYYNFLWKDKGVIKWDKKERAEIKDEAEKSYVIELKSKKASGKISQNAYEVILSGLDTDPSLVQKMKRIALKRYFDKCIKEGIELF